jgi:accessory gene regulator B
MEALARKLARNVSSSLGYDDEKEAVVAYGLIAIIQVTVTYLLVLCFGILTGVPAEAMIMSFSVSILRKYSGGAHAKTAEFCTFFSVVYCVSTAVISKRLLAGISSPVSMAVALVIIFGLSFLAVYQFAPVDSPNKPIKTEAKKKRMRKGSFIVLSIYLMISIVFFILEYKSEIFRSYEISMLFGISWQIFTLTHPGDLFIGKMNDIFRLGKEVHK